MYYEQIKAEVVKCCPEIVYGVSHNFKGNNLRCSDCGCTTEESIKNKDCSYSSKEIELHHILRTIPKPMYLKTLGNQLRLSDDGGLLGYYDLSLPAALQSEETLKGLSELLTGNK